KNIDDLLGVLQKTHSPILVYRSASIQGPTWPPDYLNPRAIIGPYGDENHSLYMSFNGSASEAQYKNLEVLEINRVTPKPSANIFRYFDIEFGAEEHAEQLSWPQTQSAIHFSQANPMKCAACHGDPARPIFQSYPIWKGIYGSFDLSEYPDETKEFESFKFQAPNRPRYRQLDLANYDGRMGKKDDGILMGGNKVNLDSDLGDANETSVARLAEQTPNYEKYKFAILGAMLNCQRITDFFPQTMNDQMIKNLRVRFNLGEINVESNLEK